MQIKILGSAAAEGIPALWCECETCGQAREKGGKDIRQRASYLIDDDTMVDFGPDCDGGHMGARVVVKFAERLKAMGALAAGAQLCVSHFSHGGKALHDDLRRFFEPHQIRPAYDGLTLTTPDER
ncbi:MAG: hypothetical protein WC708_11475 [Lentisphaeria bacterium]